MGEALKDLSPQVSTASRGLGTAGRTELVVLPHRPMVRLWPNSVRLAGSVPSPHLRPGAPIGHGPAADTGGPKPKCHRPFSPGRSCWPSGWRGRTEATQQLAWPDSGQRDAGRRDGGGRAGRRLGTHALVPPCRRPAPAGALKFGGNSVFLLSCFKWRRTGAFSSLCLSVFYRSFHFTHTCFLRLSERVCVRV